MKNNIPKEHWSSAGVYQILNTVNGKCYIGSSHKLNDRARAHRNQLNRGKHHSLYLSSAYKKYGPDAFEFNLLEVVDIVNQPIGLLTDTEDRLIKLHKANNRAYGYNVREVAESTLGMKQSEEFRAKKRQQKMKIDHPFRVDQKGEKHPVAKLSNKTAKEIKILITKGWQNIAIGKYLNINSSYVTNIKKGVCWQAITITKEEIEQYDEPEIPASQKLNIKQVKQIKYLLSIGGMVIDIVEHFGYKYNTVFYIKNNKTHTQIELTPADCELFKKTIPADFLQEARGRVELRNFNILSEMNSRRNSSFSPMTKKKVIIIKQLLESKSSLLSIRKRFGITEESIVRIRNGKLFPSISIPNAGNTQ
ncbi:GIY-YIG nuclease family protein [Spirosoma spitsbergense]|uniref:GIY-YIG nuclease family protein n=1 Tax=Spirosoma spitsbergense TaxID=431554 RepID=UPI0003760E72|nr:GIY-YIG nuclease family protein [Spirosoma spitsbergense]